MTSLHLVAMIDSQLLQNSLELKSNWDYQMDVCTEDYLHQLCFLLFLVWNFDLWFRPWWIRSTEMITEKLKQWTRIWRSNELEFDEEKISDLSLLWYHVEIKRNKEIEEVEEQGVSVNGETPLIELEKELREEQLFWSALIEC